MIDGIRQIARSCGYAVGVHGTQERDLDLIACPWVDWAIPAEQLVDALRVGLELHIATARDPEAKPRGRLAWLLLAFGTDAWHDDRPGGRYRGPRLIDLSVMPR